MQLSRAPRREAAPGLLGGASRAPMTVTGSEQIPLAQPVLGPEEEARVLDVLRSGRLSLGPVGPEFERAFAHAVGARCASAVSSGTAGLHLALRAVGVSDGDEVVTSPFSFVATRQRGAVTSAPGPVFADIDQRTLNLDPSAAAAAITDRTAALLPVHVFGYPADMRGARGARRADRRGRVRGARRAPMPTAARSAARGHPAVFGFYANKQMTTGEGGIVVGADAAAQGADGLRAQPGPRARTWTGSTTTGSASTTASRTSPARSASPSSSASTSCWPAARGSPRCTARRWPASKARRCRARTAGGPGAAGSSTSSSCRAASTATTPSRALGDRGVPAKPYFPAIHLMSFYRERVRPPRGRVPGLRGRRRPLDRAAVLPADDRGAGRARGRGAARPCFGATRERVAIAA